MTPQYRILADGGTDTDTSVVAVSHDAEDASFTSDSWDGDAAVSSYPDPGDDDTSVETFRQNFTFAPPADSDAASNKSAYKGPIRGSHGGAINTNALTAVLAAINGSRGGFSGIGQDTLKSGYNDVAALAVAAGTYDDTGDAPGFAATGGDAGAGTDAGGGDATPGTPGTIEASFAGRIGAAGTAGTGRGLTGVIWAAGTHTLYYNGEPATVHVPEATIQPTFERLEKRIAAGDATIGFDHPDSDSVAAATSVGEIGDMTGVALSADGHQIVLTNSDLTNNKAREAMQAGAFEGYDFSVVGDIHLEASDEGSPQTTDDGALDVSAVDIHRVDVVRNGAVASAGVGAMPQVAAQAARLATAAPSSPATTFAATLEATAADLQTITTMTDTTTDDSGGGIDTDPDDLEAAQAVLDDAKGVIEAKDDRIDTLEADLEAREAEADAFGEIAAAHGLDPDDEDVDPQDVIDEHTEDLRAEIADLEAGSPKYETGGDDGPDVEERTEDLRGTEVSTLEAMAGTLAREYLEAERERAQRSGAVTAGAAGGFAAGGAGGHADEETDRLVTGVLGASDTLEMEASDASPSAFVAEKYDLDPSAHSSEESMRQALLDARNGNGGGD